MKYNFFYILFFSSISFLFGQIQSNVTWSVSPSPFSENEQISINVKGLDLSKWSTEEAYLWTWFFDSNDVEVNSNVNWNGEWDNSKESMKMTKNNDGSLSFDFKPTDLFQYNGIGKIGVLAKSKDGTGDKKTPDFFFEVGKFDVTIKSPINNPSIISQNGSITISTEGSINLNYYLKNGNDIISESLDNKNFSQVINGPQNTGEGYKLLESTTLKLLCEDANNKENYLIISFDIEIEPSVKEESPPISLQDGINYIDNDPTKIYLQLNVPNKDYVYVLGNFNNYIKSDESLMKRDKTSNKFWIDIKNLQTDNDYFFQYHVFSKNPVSGSPTTVKVADPFSTLILSSYDDIGIPEKSFPNIPDLPSGSVGEFTYFKTGVESYKWKIKNFKKPKKEDLIIYEVLIRDFDKDRNIQNLIDRIEYFKRLNINAIELMPIMEFEGNESWGYNTSYHMALDKFYGTNQKFKEFIDLCHQNGIAVILDLALNHAFGRNPMVKIWMDDPDNNGWGGPSSENPYFNQKAKHSYSVGYDFNHQNNVTQYYTQRVLKHWIENFKIDGIRWDLTKGFTQNCSENDSNCTDKYQKDRVEILKQYADYSWSMDPNHYVIFEHLGSDNEEKEWANYRIKEGKGIMLWGKMNTQFNQLTMGFQDNANINRMDHRTRGFTSNRLISYAESHDEERLMYKNIIYGNSTNSNHDVKNLKTSLQRMNALGSTFILSPGPKMIWHFSEMGMDNSLFTCKDGTIKGKDCKLETKPQPQWDSEWSEISLRREIYNNWKKLIYLKINEPVFEGDYNLSILDNNKLFPQLEVWNNQIIGDSLKYVYVISNFDVKSKNIHPKLPINGEWKNLITLDVIDFNSSFSLELSPGASIVLGNYKDCGSLDFDNDNIGNLCDSDLDGDGVLNEMDDCPNTPLGSKVNTTGCVIFELPVNNNKVSITNASCIGTSDGSLGLSIEDNTHDYSITVTGQNDPITITGENKTSSITGLAKGTYNVCFTVTGQAEYEQCFEVAIGEPKALSAFIDVDNDKRTTNIQLGGSKSYNIEVNGERFEVKGGNFNTTLPTGLSIIIISTDLDCQGVIEREIFISEDIFYYPNPTRGEVDVFVNGEDKGVKMSVFTTKGDLVFTRDQEILGSRKTELDLSGVQAGTYLVTLEGTTVRKTFKIIKK